MTDTTDVAILMVKGGILPCDTGGGIAEYDNFIRGIDEREKLR